MSTSLAQQLWTRVAERARRSSGADAVGQRLLEDLGQVSSGGAEAEARLLARWEPELCISLLRVPTATNHAALRKLLARASREWVVEFVERGGLAVLLEALEKLGSGPGPGPGGGEGEGGGGETSCHSNGGLSNGVERAMSQLRVVECIREVMNSRAGLSFLLDHGDHVHQLINGLDSHNPTVKMQVFELLCALCMCSSRGHILALDALFYFTTSRGYRYRFEPLVIELRTSQSGRYSATIVAFANCLVQGADSLTARVRLRNEMLGVGLGTEISRLKKTCDRNDELFVQLDVFEDAREEDEEQMEASSDMLALSHHQLFHTLFEKVVDTPQALHLHSILLNLAQVDTANSKSDLMWSLLEDVTSRALDGSLHTTQRRLGRIPAEIRNSSTQTPRARGGRRWNIAGSRVSSRTSSTQTSTDLLPTSDDTSNKIEDMESVTDSVIIEKKSCEMQTECCLKVDISTQTSEEDNCESVSSPPTSNIPLPPPMPNVQIPLPPPMPINNNPPPIPPPMPNSIPIPPPIPPPLPSSMGTIPPPPPMAPLGSAPPPPPPLPSNSIPMPPPPPMGGSMGPPPPPMLTPEQYFACPTRHSLPASLPSQWTPDSPDPSATGLVRYNTLPHPKKRLKTLNWTKIPPNKNFADTVWQSSCPRKLDIDLTQIEELFCQRSATTPRPASCSSLPPSASRGSSNKSDSPPPAATLNVLDSKRSLGVNILLRQFKELGVPGLLSAIREGKGELLGADKLRGLLRLLPEPDEISLIRTQLQQQRQLEDANGSPHARLGDAESFYLQLSEVPAFALRVRAMLQKEEFGPSAAELRPQLNAVLGSCEALVTNASLREFLALILQLGNLLNAGSYAGNAVGFRLSTLPRLLETRANKPRMTFLHFAVDVASAQPSCLEFLPELALVHEAARISLESIEEEVRSLVNGLEKLEREIERSNDAELKEQFQDFLSSAGIEAAKLSSQSSELGEASARLARHFCEDEAKFQLSECLSLIADFLNKTQLARKENEQRRIQEARVAKQQQLQATCRGSVVGGGVKRSRGGRHSTDSSDGEDTCVVDKLMKEIRSGTFKLRRCAPA